MHGPADIEEHFVIAEHRSHVLGTCNSIDANGVWCVGRHRLHIVCEVEVVMIDGESVPGWTQASQRY